MLFRAACSFYGGGLFIRRDTSSQHRPSSTRWTEESRLVGRARCSMSDAEWTAPLKGGAQGKASDAGRARVRKGMNIELAYQFPKAVEHKERQNFCSARLLPSERLVRFPLRGGEGGVTVGNASVAGKARVRHGINIELAYLLPKAAEHKERQNFCSARLLPSERLVRFPLRGGEGGLPTGGSAPWPKPPSNPRAYPRRHGSPKPER